MDRIALAFSPLRDASPRDVVAWSRSAEERGYEAVFIPESYCDSLAYAEAVALATRRLRVGTGITNVYLRQPTLLAAQAAAVQEFSGGRLLLGQPRPAVPPRILAAALALRMIDVAGELADGVMFNLFPLTRYPRALVALRRGAARAGRDGAALEVCHFTTCYLADDGQAALHEARRMLARYANLPFYGNMLARSGFADEVEAIRAAWTRRDVAAAERAVSDALADAVTLVGDPVRCRERVAAYRAAGATLTIVFPNPVGEPRAAAVARALVAFAPR
ncbi:MAG: LLM class flavin-dependent oxidoreductase [Deltaproteobacteria bacterium]|nr:MAG: LLM class flavin-dependent oxidoreductase [Deltaproteobacteria bacterium]